MVWSVLWCSDVVSLLRLGGAASSARCGTWRSCSLSWQEEAERHVEFPKRGGAFTGRLHEQWLGTGEAETKALTWFRGKHSVIKTYCTTPASNSSKSFFSSSWSNQVCFSANQLVDIFALDPHLPISKEHFRQICPAIIQQLLGDACETAEHQTRGSLPTALESKTFHLSVSPKSPRSPHCKYNYTIHNSCY